MHLDKSTEDQMTKFIVAWEQYKSQLEGMKMETKRQVRDSLMDPKLDEMIKDKLNEE